MMKGVQPTMKKIGAIVMCLVLGGCVVYKPRPLDLQRDTEVWRKASQIILPLWNRSSMEKKARIGLLLNPELNKARLTWMRSKRAAKYAGMWDDPTLELGGERDLTEHIYNFSVTPTLSLPVTGTKRLARQVAELYSAADYAELRAQENDYLMNLRTLFVKIQVVHEKGRLIRERAAQTAVELKDHEKLQQLGEISTADLYDATQRNSSTTKELQELEKEHLTLHMELVSMIGLHPVVGELEIQDALPREIPAEVSAPTPQQLMQHPKLLAAMAAYRTSEAELKLEIRKQYPTFELGIGYIREDEHNKLPLSRGMSLPLWNRNREAIARATGSRSIAHLTAVQQWHELLLLTYSLRQQQKLLLQHCRAEFEQLRVLRDTAQRQEELYRLGEIALPALAATRHEMYNCRLAFLDCLDELLKVQIALQYLQPSAMP